MILSKSRHSAAETSNLQDPQRKAGGLTSGPLNTEGSFMSFQMYRCLAACAHIHMHISGLRSTTCLCLCLGSRLLLLPLWLCWGLRLSWLICGLLSQGAVPRKRQAEA